MLIYNFLEHKNNVSIVYIVTLKATFYMLYEFELR